MHDDDDDQQDRHAELSAAALAGEMTAAEEAELAALDAADPDARAERAALEALVARLEGVEAWEEAEPSDELAGRVAAIADEQQEDPAQVDRERAVALGASWGDEPSRPRAVGGAAAAASAVQTSIGAARAPRRRLGRRLLPLVAGAAACLAIGVGVGAAAVGARETPVVEGAPGTLGAIEEVAFVGAPAAIAIDGALVAHTWGTETVLTIDGLPRGEAFTVVVVGEDGTEHASGTMLGTDVTIDCRLNAAVLREDVATVEIRALSGEEIAHADVVDV